MASSLFDDETLASLLGNLDGPMVQPEEDRRAYLNAPPTRLEIVNLLILVESVLSVGLLADLADNEGDQAGRVSHLLVAHEQNGKIVTMMRELLNAGVDPNWDPHS